MATVTEDRAATDDRGARTRRALEREIRRERLRIGAMILVAVLVPALILGAFAIRRPMPAGHAVAQVVEVDHAQGLGLLVAVDGAERRLGLSRGETGIAAGDRICLLRLEKMLTGEVSYDRATPAACADADGG